MPLDESFDVTRIARVARLALTDDEAAALKRDAERVLAAFSDLPDAAPVDAAEARGTWREDSIMPPPEGVRDGIIAAFPRRSGDLVRVPRGL